MPQIIDLATLMTKCRRRADMPSPDQFIGDTELQEYIQESYEELYNILVGKYEDYFIKSATEADVRSYPALTTGVVAGTADYCWPSDYAKLKRFAIGTGGGTRVVGVPPPLMPLYRCTWNEELVINPRQQQGQPTHYIRYGRADYSDLMTGAGFRLVMTPDRAYLLDIKYIPTPPVLTAEAPPLGLDFVMGWAQYVVCDTVIKMKDKQESDVSVLLEKRAHILSVIESTLSPADAGQTAHVEGTAAGMSSDIDDWGEAAYD